MSEIWLRPNEVVPTAPGFNKFTPKSPRIGIDTNIVMSALFEQRATTRSLLQAGKSGDVELALSMTFDDEFQPRQTRDGYDPTKDDLWPFIKDLPRLPRPSAVVGKARVGEMVVGNDGAHGAVQGGQTGKQRDNSIRDEEHVSSAFSWGAVAFVTLDRRLLGSERLRERGWRIVEPEEVLRQLELIMDASE